MAAGRYSAKSNEMAVAEHVWALVAIHARQADDCDDVLAEVVVVAVRSEGEATRTLAKQAEAAALMVAVARMREVGAVAVRPQERCGDGGGSDGVTARRRWNSSDAAVQSESAAWWCNTATTRFLRV